MIQTDSNGKKASRDIEKNSVAMTFTRLTCDRKRSKLKKRERKKRKKNVTTHRIQ